VTTKTGRIHDNTQDDRMLRLLAYQSGSWVPASEMVRVSLQYCRVVASLRAKGFEIQNRVEVRNGTRFGFYKLIRPIATGDLRSAPPSLRSPASLFGDISPIPEYPT